MKQDREAEWQTLVDAYERLHDWEALVLHRIEIQNQNKYVDTYIHVIISVQMCKYIHACACQYVQSAEAWKRMQYYCPTYTFALKPTIYISIQIYIYTCIYTYIYMYMCTHIYI